MFAKLINETTIEKAPRCTHVGSATFVLPSAEHYAAGGYYEIEEFEKPQYELQDTEDSSYTLYKTDEV